VIKETRRCWNERRCSELWVQPAGWLCFWAGDFLLVSFQCRCLLSGFMRCFVCWRQSLLEDPSHIVRSLLAFGLCKICAVCWEYIPAEVIKTLLTSLVQKHAWDSSNTDVRLSVVKVCFLYLICFWFHCYSETFHLGGHITHCIPCVTHSVHPAVCYTIQTWWIIGVRPLIFLLLYSWTELSCVVDRPR